MSKRRIRESDLRGWLVVHYFEWVLSPLKKIILQNKGVVALSVQLGSNDSGIKEKLIQNYALQRDEFRYAKPRFAEAVGLLGFQPEPTLQMRQCFIISIRFSFTL